MSTTYVSTVHKQLYSHCVFDACCHVSVSSEHLECRLLSILLDHPMNTGVRLARWSYANLVSEV